MISPGGLKYKKDYIQNFSTYQLIRQTKRVNSKIALNHHQTYILFRDMCEASLKWRTRFLKLITRSWTNKKPL